MKKIIIAITFLLLIGISAALVFLKQKNIDLSLPIRETLDIVQGIENKINNPPPLKIFDNGIPKTDLTLNGVLKWTNTMRKENGNLGLLTENDQLDSIAKIRLDDMFQKQYFEHISPTGIGVSDIAKDRGFEYIMIGENIALGNFDGDQALVEAWMNSPGHRANILNHRYTEIGIAVEKGKYENKETWMAIQVFSLPRSYCPDIDGTIKQKIESNNIKIASLENSANELRSSIENSKPLSQDEIVSYNNNVNEYNAIVSDLNNLIKETKNYVATYNLQVNEFNKCANGT